jgi:hypothetical protein
MKKVLASITVFFYFIVSCGVVINLHYCMGHYQSFTLFEAKSKECGKCGMHIDDNNGCCRDEVKIIKLQDDQNSTFVSYTIQGVDATVITPSEFIAASVFNIEGSLHYNNHSPPLLTQQDTYLQNCVFRI